MSMKLTKRTNSESYFGLIKSFPLTDIKSESHLARAQIVIDQLLGQDLDEGSQDYLDALKDLVEHYEAQHTPMPDATEADVLRELMRATGSRNPGSPRGFKSRSRRFPRF